MMPRFTDYFTIVYMDTSGKVIVRPKRLSGVIRMIENSVWGTNGSRRNG